MRILNKSQIYKMIVLVHTICFCRLLGKAKRCQRYNISSRKRDELKSQKNMKLLFDVMLEIFFASSHVNNP